MVLAERNRTSSHLLSPTLPLPPPSWYICALSLVPRPHPLTRRNGLVNQVEFLGLVGACILAMFKIFCGNLLKKSAVTVLENKPKKFDFIHQTVSCWEARDVHRLMCANLVVWCQRQQISVHLQQVYC